MVINNDNTIKEQVIILQENNLLGNTIQEINQRLNWILTMSGDETEPANFYNKEKIVNSDKSGLVYSYDFKHDNFVVESEVLRACYDEYNLTLNEQKLSIYARDFKCEFALGENYDLTVNITADGEVIDGNYDKKSGDTYTWNLDESNSNYISLNVDRTKTNQGLENTLLIVLAVGAILIIGAILLVAYMRNKNSNKL